MVLLESAKSKRPRIGVVGSANIDMVLRVERLPACGETITATAVRKYPGGKGANQAVAAAKLGGEVFFAGKIGADSDGATVLTSLSTSGVNVDLVVKEPSTTTGLAVITVSATGDNIIVYFPGANDFVDTDYADIILPKLQTCDILLLQLEIPVKTIEYILKHLPRSKPLVILDPAPACDISILPLNRINILTPNQTELEILTGTRHPVQGGNKLLSQGVQTVICKVGEEGAWLITNKTAQHIPGFNVHVVDTTAAGDGFNGALAVALGYGLDLVRSIVFANAVGALTCTREGAQPALPSYEDVRRFLEKV